MQDYVKLIRIAEVPSKGMFGVLKVNETPFCVTLEREWRENRTNESCIPTGQYTCKMVQSPRFGKTWEIVDVPGRTNILFHAGNRVDDSLGCILLAQHYGKLYGNLAIVNSGDTFKKFIHLTHNSNELHLTITECF
jgi:hypothetical protein